MILSRKTTIFLSAILIIGGAVFAKDYYVEMDKRSDLALLQALKDDKLGKFKKLLKSGANPNVVFGQKDWVMGLATEEGKMAYLKLAITHSGDANLNNPYSSYNRPIFLAILNNNDEAIKYLIEKGADLDARHCSKCAEAVQYSPASMAATFNEYALVYYIIEKKGRLTPLETKQLIFKIENGLIDLKSEANQWRIKVVNYLRAKGHTVEPKMHSRFEKKKSKRNKTKK